MKKYFVNAAKFAGLVVSTAVVVVVAEKTGFTAAAVKFVTRSE